VAFFFSPQYFFLFLRWRVLTKLSRLALNPSHPEILLPQLPKQLGLQVCAVMPVLGIFNIILRESSDSVACYMWKLLWLWRQKDLLQNLKLVVSLRLIWSPFVNWGGSSQHWGSAFCPNDFESKGGVPVWNSPAFNLSVEALAFCV
jgi:hypothetical protein